MSVMEIDDNLNVRTMGKYFKNVFKAANYNEDREISRRSACGFGWTSNTICREKRT